jgi:hypothetical protein
MMIPHDFSYVYMLYGLILYLETLYIDIGQETLTG